MDDNGSKSLDRDELMKGLYDYGLRFTKAEVTQIMTDIDKDRSGSISFNEFLQALRVGCLFIGLRPILVNKLGARKNRERATYATNHIVR